MSIRRKVSSQVYLSYPWVKMSDSFVSKPAERLTRQLEQLQSEPHEHPFPEDEQPQSISMLQREQVSSVLVCELDEDRDVDFSRKSGWFGGQEN